MIISRLLKWTCQYFLQHLSSSSLYLFVSVESSCLRKEASYGSPLQPADCSAILKSVNFHCHRMATWHLLAVNSKINWKFSTEKRVTRFSCDNKENLSKSICSENASDFCHDRKSAFRRAVANTEHFYKLGGYKFYGWKLVLSRWLWRESSQGYKVTFDAKFWLSFPQ